MVDLPIWFNPYELVVWVRYRDPMIVAGNGDWHGMAAQNLYGTDPIYGHVGDLVRKLQEGHLIGYGIRAGEPFAPIPAIEWTRIALAPLDLGRQNPYSEIRFARAEVLKNFPEAPAARPSHGDVVTWCREWIESGNGTGMDKAWGEFHSIPKHKGLSRDDVFRPAWREAKSR